MAETKEIIFKVSSNTDEAIQKIIKYRSQIEQLRNEEKRLAQEQEEAGKDNRALIEANLQQRKALQREIAKETNAVQNSLRAESELYKNTLDGKRAQLIVEKQKLAYLEQGTEAYEQQRIVVDELNTAVKNSEEAYGVHSRNVGNYTSIVQGLAGSMRQLTQAGIIAFAMFADGGEESEETRKKMVSMQKAMMGLMLVTNIATKATKSDTIANVANNVVRGIGINQANAQARAEAKLVAMKTADAGATKILTAVQWLWNAALAANPIFLLITAISAVIIGIVALTSVLGKNKDQQKLLNEQIAEYDALLSELEKHNEEQELKSLERKKELTKAYADEIERLKESGATAEEIARKKTELEEQLQLVDDERQEQIIKNTREQINLTQKKLIAEQLFLGTLKEGSKKYKEQKEKVDDLAKSLNDLQKSLTNEEIKQSEHRIKQAEKEVEKKSSVRSSAYDNEKKKLDDLQKLYKADFELRTKYIYDYTKSIEENAKDEKEFNRQVSQANIEFTQNQKKQQLALERKYGKLTESQYKTELEVLKKEYEKFLVDLENSVKREQAEILKSAITLAGGEMLDKQLEEIERKFYDAERAIKKDATLSAEEKTYYLIKLDNRRVDEIKSAEDKALKEREETINKSLKSLYENDLRLNSLSAEERLNAEIEMLNKEIEERKKAGLITMAQEEELAKKKLDLIALSAEKELLMAKQNSKEEYEITKKYLEQEQQLYEVGSIEWLRLEREKTELYKEEINRRIEEFERWSDRGFEVAGALNDFLNALSDNQIERSKAESEAKIKDLDNQLNAGLMSQAHYDKEKNKIEKAQAKKELEVKRRQAIQEKIINSSQIAMNTATAIMKALANVGLPWATPLIATTSAIGALQLATVLAQPLPQAESGGLIEGARHSQGGVLIEAEGGERIVAREPAKAFPELLNLISYIGKHGGAPNYNSNITEVTIENQQLANAIGNVFADKMKDVNIVVGVDDIISAEDTRVKVENSMRL